MNVNLNDAANNGIMTIEFIKDKLSYPNASFSKVNQSEFIELLNGFPYGNVDINNVIVYDLNDIDEDGAYVFSKDRIFDALTKLDDEDNIIYSVLNNAVDHINTYVEVIKSGVFDADEPASAHTQNLNIVLENIIAIFNIANEHVGGKKKKAMTHKKKKSMSHKKKKAMTHKKKKVMSIKKKAKKL